MHWRVDNWTIHSEKLICRERERSVKKKNRINDSMGNILCLVWNKVSQYDFMTLFSHLFSFFFFAEYFLSYIWGPHRLCNIWYEWKRLNHSKHQHKITTKLCLAINNSVQFYTRFFFFWCDNEFLYVHDIGRSFLCVCD